MFTVAIRIDNIKHFNMIASRKNPLLNSGNKIFGTC